MNYTFSNFLFYNYLSNIISVFIINLYLPITIVIDKKFSEYGFDSFPRIVCDMPNRFTWNTTNYFS